MIRQYLRQIVIYICDVLIYGIHWINQDINNLGRNRRRIGFNFRHHCSFGRYFNMAKHNNSHKAPTNTKKKKLKSRLMVKTVSKLGSLSGFIWPVLQETKTQDEKTKTKPTPTEKTVHNIEVSPEKKKEIYQEKWRQIDAGSRQDRPVDNCNPKSLTVYNDLRVDYDILTACKRCYVDTVYTEQKHVCSRNFLLVRPKKTSTKWTQIRNVHKSFEHTVTVCESMIEKSQCPQSSKCTRPHSQVEYNAWNIVKKHNWFVDNVLNDLRLTDLSLRYLMDQVSHKICMLIVCKRCLQDQQYDKFLKAKRKPSCQNGHSWEPHNQVIVLKVDGKDPKFIKFSSKTDLEDLELPTEITPNMLSLQALLPSTKPSNVIHVYFDSKKRGFRGKSSSQGGMMRTTGFIDNTDDCKDGFDDDIDDIMTTEDIDVSQVEHRFKEEYIREKDPKYIYYELKAHEDLQELLDEDEHKYKLCAIKLNGSQKAQCVTLDDDKTEIEIRGRQNCGPTCNGDIVVVEVKEEEVLDAE